jgi:formylglycine-generating enzyme required for sulfatase activity
MVVVPAGEFTMGAPRRDQQQQNDEGPQHQVRFENPFAIGKFEVTRGEYAAFINDSEHNTEGGCFHRPGAVPILEIDFDWQHPGYQQDDNHPAVCISWSDATTYASWLSEYTGEEYRHPSEAEWEYAARGGTTSERYWGSSEDDGCDFANGADLNGESELPPGWTVANCDDGYAHTAAVGSLKANEFGIHDVLGNVGEWVADCWNDSYDGAPADGSAWTTGACDRPILRGASWVDDPRFLRSANRYGYYFMGAESKNSRYVNFGFRVARRLQ